MFDLPGLRDWGICLCGPAAAGIGRRWIGGGRSCRYNPVGREGSSGPSRR